MGGLTSTPSKGKPSQSASSRNIKNERINAIYDSVGIITMFAGTTAMCLPVGFSATAMK